jgi:hypothetical protein
MVKTMQEAIYPRERLTTLRAAAIAGILFLLPFATVALLWFIGVVRDRLEEHEDR